MDPSLQKQSATIRAIARPKKGLQLQTQKTGSERNFRPVADYSMPNVSEKMVRIILSYTDYVNRVVWSKKV